MSIFGQSSGSSLFGQPQQQNASPFGSTNTNTTQQKPGLFGSLNTNTATSQPQEQGGGLFGSTTQSTQGGGLFASSQPQQTGGGGLFGNTQNQPQQQGSGLFGSTTQPTQGGGLFGSSQPQQTGGGGLFGSTQNQSQQQGGSGLFGSSQPQQQQGGGLFGSLGNSINQQSQQQHQQNQQQQQGSILGQSRLFQQSELTPRKLPPKVSLFGLEKKTKPLPLLGQKPVTEQIELAYTKWNPLAPNTPFRTYLYNAVQPESVPFYGPTPLDDEAKWEEALAKRPIPGSVPILVRGFEELGNRIKAQYFSLGVLQGRLHEINDGLNTLLQKHDLQISVRAAECRRRHERLARQCLHLASKTQVLRNRGFAMDSAEEVLRQKLLMLEKGVLDPALNGRSEEIWARMVSVRERGRQLQRDFERAGKGLAQGKEELLDEEVMKRAKKILEDYSSQLTHLAKELAQIQKDWADWEASKPLANGDGGARR